MGAIVPIINKAANSMSAGRQQFQIMLSLPMNEFIGCDKKRALARFKRHNERALARFS